MSVPIYSTLDIARVMAELSKISQQYPDEEIIVKVQAGRFIVGFVRGDYGDRQHNAWNAVMPFLEP